ncbi:MBL fold metallo-hydrolase [Acidobacteriota bacterium]
MIEVNFIGTGGSVATIERDNTSFLINTDHNLILVDVPGSVTQKIKKLGFNPDSVRTLLVTHTHPDHVYGLPALVHSLMLTDMVLDLYGSALVVDFCRQILDIFHLLDEKIKCRVNFIPLEPGDEFVIEDSLRCMAASVPHSQSSLAFQFSFLPEGIRLLYSGDTPAHPPLFELAENIDYLIHDCSAPSRFFEEFSSLKRMHTDSLALGQLAQSAGIKYLIPCHFFGEIDYPISEIEQEIKENYKGKLIIPEDFMKIALTLED